jgi:hypothetical protein
MMLRGVPTNPTQRHRMVEHEMREEPAVLVAARGVPGDKESVPLEVFPE